MEPCGASPVNQNCRGGGGEMREMEVGVRLSDIFNKYHAGLLIHKLYTKIHNTTKRYNALQTFLSHL